MTAATNDICDRCGRDIYVAGDDNAVYYGWWVCNGCGEPAYPINTCSCKPLENFRSADG